MHSHPLKAARLFAPFILAVFYEVSYAQSMCPSFTQSYPPVGTFICPGSSIVYTCTLSSTGLGVITTWSGTAFKCPSSNDQIVLTQKASGSVQPFNRVSCGNISAVTTNVTSTCYTSVLTVPAVQALNGTSVMCSDGTTGAIVGNVTVNLITAPPDRVQIMSVNSTSVDQLAVTWTPPTTGCASTSYSISINGSSPVVIGDNGSSLYTYTFTGLINDTLYTVSVVAINSAGASDAVLQHRRTLAAPPSTIQVTAVVKPNNTLHQVEINWIPVGGSVVKYNVKSVFDAIDDSSNPTSCTSSPCFFVQNVSIPAQSYHIYLASINGDGDIGPANSNIRGMVQSNIDAKVITSGPSNTMIGCKFNTVNESLYCMVCCSTDSSLPSKSNVYNISISRGTEVTVQLDGLTSDQVYYCKAAGINTNSSNCGGPVVGNVAIYFTFSTASSSSSNNPAQFYESFSQTTYVAIVVLPSSLVIVIVIIIILVIIKFSRNRKSKNIDNSKDDGVKDTRACEVAPIGETAVIPSVINTISSRDRENCGPALYETVILSVESTVARQHLQAEGGYEDIDQVRRTAGIELNQTELQSACFTERAETAMAPQVYSTPDLSKKKKQLEGKSPVYALLGPEGTPHRSPYCSDRRSAQIDAYIKVQMAPGCCVYDDQYSEPKRQTSDALNPVSSLQPEDAATILCTTTRV